MTFTAITALPAAMRMYLKAESYDSPGARGKLYCIIAGSAVCVDINMELDIITIVNQIAKASICYLLDFLCFVGSTNRYDWSDSLVGGNGFPAVDVTSSPVPFPLELITSYCPLWGVRSPGLYKKA